MIKHIVMFKLKEDHRDKVAEMADALRSLHTIETLSEMEVGVSFAENPRPQDMDIVLTTVFDDKEGLAVFRTHPVHLPVRDMAKAYCETRVVDYDNA